ncbi:MAG: type II toxin-antitoxin system RelE/ParE family toxin [Patescibacteria group bacterium]
MYEIVHHRFVEQKDLKRITKGNQKKILRSIEKKLKTHPETFGKPLLGELKGYYRLRVDPYRVVYFIEKEKIIVLIIHIGLRKNFLAYIESAKRLGLM